MEFTGMEALIAIGVALGTAVAVYFVSVIGIREKSFEEAIAEQKKRSDDLLGQHKPHKKKVTKDKNANKKLKKKERHQAELSDEVVDEVEERKRTIEIVDEPEILDDEEEEVVVEGEKVRAPSRRPSIPSTRRDSIIKPILLNKDETPVVTSSPPQDLNNFEQIHPKDDCELKHQETSTPPSPHPKSGSNTPVDEVTDSPATKRQRKKQNALGKDDDATSARIEQLIDRLPLTSTEIQNLIDVLLNKQHAGDSEWVKNTKSSNNSVGDLKRQLEVKDKMLEDEKSSVKGLQDKLKELRNEFSAEKTKFANVRRSLEEQVQARNLEAQSLNVRLRQVSEISMGDKQELKAQLQRLSNKLKEVTDEYDVVKIEYRNYRESEQGVRTKLDTLERESGALKTQCGHLENQLKNAFASNQEMSNQIRTLHENLRLSEERKKEAEFSYNAEYRKLQERETVLLNELALLKSNLTGLEAENGKLREKERSLEATVKSVDEVNSKYEEIRKSEVALKNVVNELKSSVSGLNEVVAEKNKLLGELESEVARLNNKTSELEQSNAAGEQGKDKELGEMNHKVDELKSQVEELSSQVAAGKVKNDELRVKNQKLVESLNVTEQSLQSRIEGSEKLLSAEESRKNKALSIAHTILGEKPQVDSEDWMAAILTRIGEHVSELQKRPVENPEVQESFDKKTKELQDEVNHYQSMLKQTEGLLSNLQASINEEESKWVSQTAEKDKEIQRLRTEVAEHKPTTDNTAHIEELKRTNASLEASIAAHTSRISELTTELASASARVKSLESHTNGKLNGEEEEDKPKIVKEDTQKPKIEDKTPVTPTAPVAPVTPIQEAQSSPPVSKEKKKKKKAKNHNNH